MKQNIMNEKLNNRHEGIQEKITAIAVVNVEVLVVELEGVVLVHNHPAICKYLVIIVCS